MREEWVIPFHWDGELFKEIEIFSTNPFIIKFKMNNYCVDLHDEEDIDRLKLQSWYQISADKQREVKKMMYGMHKITFEELDQRDIDLHYKLKKELNNEE